MSTHSLSWPFSNGDFTAPSFSGTRFTACPPFFRWSLRPAADEESSRGIEKFSIKMDTWFRKAARKRSCEHDLNPPPHPDSDESARRFRRGDERKSGRQFPLGQYNIEVLTNSMTFLTGFFWKWKKGPHQSIEGWTDMATGGCSRTMTGRLTLSIA